MGPMLYYPDPVIDMFPGDDELKQYRKGERLVIKVSQIIMLILLDHILVCLFINICFRPLRVMKDKHVIGVPVVVGEHLQQIQTQKVVQTSPLFTSF